MQGYNGVFVAILIFTFSFVSVSAQNQSKNLKTAARQKKNQPKENQQNLKAAQAAFDEAQATASAEQRIEKLTNFAKSFARSELKNKALEAIIAARAELGDANFRSFNSNEGIEQFRAAVATFEANMSDNVFNEIIAKIPFNLFFRNERAQAFEIAKTIEAKIADNPNRLLALANFYLTMENAAESRRLARRSLELSPNSAPAQEVLGMAERVDFDLETAARLFARALEINPSSPVAKRNLADVRRGLGQNEEALRLYQELLQINQNDEAARSGMILTLFNLDKKEEAERALGAALEQNPKNFVLQTGAADWYATSGGDSAKAIELGQKAIASEPRYVWAHLALARGWMLAKQPLEAERVLVNARQFGNFPTLDYELARAHLAAGFYDEAAEDLSKTFALKNNQLETKLAGRVTAAAATFTDLLARERRASIFQANETSDAKTEARKLKELLAFAQSLSEKAESGELLKAAQDFAKGDDDMQVYRQLYVADQLLDRKIALPQVLELMQAATADLDKSIEAPAATTAVLARELYEPRRLAKASGNLVSVPALPRETLSKIMRGRVEEIAAWTLYQENNLDEAMIRLRRAIGILPPNSAWWRSSYWKLGAALEASGKQNEALEAYLKSYKADVPNPARLTIIEALYQRINGTLDGLDKKLSASSSAPAAIAQDLTKPSSKNLNQPPPAPSASPVFRNPLPNIIAEIVPKENKQKEDQTPEATSPNLETSSSEKEKTELNSATTAVAAQTSTTPTENAAQTISPTAMPQPSGEKSPKTETRVAAETPILTDQTTAAVNSPAIAQTSTAEKAAASFGRPRIVVRNLNEDKFSTAAADQQINQSAARCTINVNELEISILRNGGTAALLVTLQNAEQTEKFAAKYINLVVSDPNDIAVKPEDGGETNANRKLFEIRSVSENTKTYSIKIESPCGEQEVKVKVR